MFSHMIVHECMHVLRTDSAWKSGLYSLRILLCIENPWSNRMQTRGISCCYVLNIIIIIVIISCSPLDPKFAGSNPTGVDGFFSERKNPEYDFLRKGNKAVGPVSYIYGTQKNLKTKLEPLSKIYRTFHAHCRKRRK